MVSKVYSVSIPDDLAEFVEQFEELKLSKILQTAIYKLREDWDENIFVARLRKQNAALTKALEVATK